MVGHTGVMEAAIKAVEALDNCIEQVTKAVESVGGQLLITADHGNAEQMRDPATGQAHTAHTNLPVPLIYVGAKKREGGRRRQTFRHCANHAVADGDGNPARDDW
ncbi:phosphoglyceromutase [Salmonella enterica subsp. salamae]|uniref:Phosphoglyceromutase n=1 Tax=Salmonella enterica subsp. salamae TaxID=59202 RepID=A0A6D2G267_SALER|nr:phosphoglyceromutase [Salmonella enterica subsp. salamae]